MSSQRETDSRPKIRLTFSNAEQVFELELENWVKLKSPSPTTAEAILTMIWDKLPLLRELDIIVVKSGDPAQWRKFQRDIHLWVAHRRPDLSRNLDAPDSITCLSYYWWSICESIIAREAKDGNKNFSADEILSKCAREDPGFQAKIGTYGKPEDPAEWKIYAEDIFIMSCARGLAVVAPDWIEGDFPRTKSNEVDMQVYQLMQQLHH
ncbi:hypothetical protein EJ08DRAFT_661008 [Tothia fuscella]|uniref:Uncharacterized protein n=1 Tax=Tothia fuscella TaxID=1048955 RepID=A0A9P4TYG8_9PEZI|nr:hypothetical protein EJ08DRAFT_661008 [Tothia fuscella]